MTLVAAFRCHRGGLLLCADREETYGIDVKREIDKIFKIEFPTGQVFIAGSGPSSVITVASLEIRQALIRGFAENIDLEREHKNLIEEVLKSIHQRYAQNLEHWPLGLIVIFAPFNRSMAPLLYRTEFSMMVSEPIYVGYGAGKTLSDYLADRLYVNSYDQIDDATLLAVAAFIFREVEKTVVGVGLGVDAIFIHEGSPLSKTIGKDHIKAIQDQIPPLSDCIFAGWKNRINIPSELIPD